ncbi:MAG: hypothetical protein OXB92_12370 [Acidimicrobiaceae bacterium]|nr:acyl dehydratase [Acidimicrobiia bacterium]MCY4494641.1 hypothetical protein [Acidimicrobiaceae bacterium]
MIPLDGPFYDQLAVGQELPRQPSATIDEGTAALYQSLVGERLAMVLDTDVSRAVNASDRRLVSPSLVMQLSIGQSTTVSRRALANLFYRNVRLVRPVMIGDSIETRVTVAGLADASHRPGRARRGKVLVDVVTFANGIEAVAYQRCPMLPQLDDEAVPGHNDDLGTTPDLDLGAYVELVPEWDFAALGPPADWAVGETVSDPTRDVIDGATSLARLTHNLAMVHRDAELSPYPQRLVYGGHVVGLAQASLSRVLPGMATVVGWHHCDHTGPTFEGDQLSFRHTLLDVAPASGGRALAVQVEGIAYRPDADGLPSTGSHGIIVLDWILIAAAP